MAEVTYPVVGEGDFPGGLRCPGPCDRVIEVGQPYREVPARLGDGIEVYVVTCVYCPPDSEGVTDAGNRASG